MKNELGDLVGKWDPRRLLGRPPKKGSKNSSLCFVIWHQRETLKIRKKGGKTDHVILLLNFSSFRGRAVFGLKTVGWNSGVLRKQRRDFRELA